MGAPAGSSMTGSSRALLLLAVTLQGVMWQTGAAAALCGDNCAADVRPVCGADGRSYSNGCVASCAGVAVTSQGYCPGDKVRFLQPASTAGLLHSLHWRSLAKESGRVIPAEVLNRFAAEGYVYRGKVDLGLLNQRSGYQKPPAHTQTPKEHSAMFQQQEAGSSSTTSSSSSTTVSQRSTAAAQASAAAAPDSNALAADVSTMSAAAAADEVAATAAADSSSSVSPLEGRVAGENPRVPSKPAAVVAKPSQSPAAQDVAIVRVDSLGNMYSKTYTYNPSRYPQLAYPPFNPAGTALVESKLSTPTKPAAAPSTAQQQQPRQQQQQQPAAASSTAARAGGAGPTPAPAAATKPAATPAAAAKPATPAVGGATRAPGAPAAGAVRPVPAAASGRGAAGSQVPAAAGRAPISAERKPSSSAAPAAAAVAPGRQQGQEGLAKPDAASNATQAKAPQQQQALGAPSNSSSSSTGAAATGNPAQQPAAATPANNTAASPPQQQPKQQQQQQQQPAAAAATAEIQPTVPRGAKLVDSPPLQLENGLLSHSQLQQQLSGPALPATQPDYLTAATRQTISELAKDAVKSISLSSSSSGSSSSGSSSGSAGSVKITNPLRQVELIPESAAVDPKAFEEGGQQSKAAVPGAASSSSSSSKDAVSKPVAAAAPAQTPVLKLESAAQQQQQLPQKGPQPLSAAAEDEEEGDEEAGEQQGVGPAAAGAQNPAKPPAAAPAAGAAPTGPAAAAVTPAIKPAVQPVTAATKPEAAAVGPVTKPSGAAAAAPAGAAAGATTAPAGAKPGAPLPARPNSSSGAAAAAGGDAKRDAAAPAPDAAAAKAPAAAAAVEPKPAASSSGSSSGGDAKTSDAAPAATAPAVPKAAAGPKPTTTTSSSSGGSGSSKKAPAAPKPLPVCDSDGLFCRDKVSGSSPAFGSQPKSGRYMDQTWLVGKARISSIKLYHNRTSGCLRGMQLTYKHHSSSSSSSSSSSGSSSAAPVVQLLGSAYKHADVATKELVLQEGEVIGKAEVWAPKCVRYLRLFTSKGQKLAVGRFDEGSVGQVLNVTRNRDTGLLVALKGWQDPAKKHAATAKKPAGSSPGVLKQVQFVWGAPWCDHKCRPAAAATAPDAAAANEPGGVIGTESGSLPNTGHHRLLLQHQQLQQEEGWLAGGGAVGQRLLAQQQLGAAREQQQRRQRASAAAAAAEAQEPAVDADLAALLVGGGDDQQQQRHQQRRRLTAAAAAAAAESQQPAVEALAELEEAAAEAEEGDAWATAELERTAAAQGQALWTHGGSGSSGRNASASIASAASIHRMLSVIKPDDRLPCPPRTFPYYAMGQIKAKASDGGFVCSGGLIGSNRVLTAGHCVWDDRNAQGPFKDLRFAPGQWKVGSKVESPFGFVDWDYVTLFDAYINDPDGEGLPYDVAVITLTKPVGTELGWLGVRADAPPCRPTPLTLSLAGYPGDDPENPRPGGWAGGCFFDRCDVTYSCSVTITNHTCDSFVGQSGAPMYDADNYVRAVHTLGILPGFSSTNGAITIQKFMLDNVMGYWKDTDGYAPTGKTAVRSSSKRGMRL